VACPQTFQHSDVFAMSGHLSRAKPWREQSNKGPGVARAFVAHCSVCSSLLSTEHRCQGRVYRRERARLQYRVSPRCPVRQPRWRRRLDLVTWRYSPFVLRCWVLHSGPQQVRLCFLVPAQTPFRRREGTQTPLPPNNYEWTFLISFPERNAAAGHWFV
jgi:hypothetical protein